MGGALDRRRLARRRADHAAAAAARVVTRVLVVEDDEPRPAPGARDQPPRTRVRGDAARRTAQPRWPRPRAIHRTSVVLDLGLPDMDGTEVITGLRGWSQAPIIVLSARADQGDKVDALDAGADDYVTKPFGMDELLARLRAALRRGGAGPATPVVETRASRSTSPPSGRTPRRRRTCTSRRRSGTCWRCSCATRASSCPQRAAAAGGMGPRVRDRDELPARLHGSAPAQARARARPAAAPHHRARDGLPVRRLTATRHARERDAPAPRAP